MSLQRAWASISVSRGFLAPASINTSRTFSASCSTAADTALMPAIHCFVLMRALSPAPARGGRTSEQKARLGRRDSRHSRQSGNDDVGEPIATGTSVLLLDALRRLPARRQWLGAGFLDKAEVDTPVLDTGLQHDDL